MNAVIRGGVLLLALVGAGLATAPAAAQIVEELAGAPPEEGETFSLFDPEVFPALFQPPALNQPADARAAARSSTRRSRQQLASVPNMFGDFGMTSATVIFQDQVANARVVGAFDIPGAGGNRPV